MKTHHIGAQNTVLTQFLNELRCPTIQQDAMRFRRNIERIGEILAYELSKELQYAPTSITTPLGIKSSASLQDELVVCSVLRAGLPLHQGVLNIFDAAENAFISAYRNHPDGSDDFTIEVEYFASPSLKNKVLLLADPMLATGKSLMAVYEGLQRFAQPKAIHILSVIGAPEGIAALEKSFPENTQLWIAAIDEGLNERGYILPGLGDAGDLAFGPKL